jgi:hypothetical protein
MTYQITKEIRIHCEDEDWFYQFTDDGEGSVEITPYATHGVEERKTGEPLYFPKNCIGTFIAVLEQLK